ncbi:GATA zinc finger domain-containing protein 8-like isoform X2 [Chrysoperla carnea]|uniref:GATA zinc finger domain-containing protein 8-like isoform X2 n=1 Tax=Chrysoperla carnea TaxID=189513 RepID=UPI001D083051|nr:GATA zinc finger domain-containing protein 8-like isoform X2 [Chrysoperla carnea]
MRVIYQFLFVYTLVNIVVIPTGSAVGISSKLDFDDDSETVSEVKHEQQQSRTQASISLSHKPQYGGVKISKPGGFEIEDFFNENNQKDKIEVKCDPTREICKPDGENVSVKGDTDDVVLTDVNVKVLTKINNKNGNNNSNLKPSTADVPILQENQGGLTFGLNQNTNHNIPLNIPNTPIVKGSGSRNSGFVPVIPIQGNLFNTDSTYNNRHFGENPPPNSVWTSRNINTNPQNPKGFYNGFNKRIYENTNPKLPTIVLNTNSWFYPISNPVIPTRSPPTSNHHFHDVSSMLEPPSEKHYPGNLFTNINYPESSVPVQNHQIVGEGLICNCVRDHTGRSHDQPFRTSFVDQPKKIKGIDDKLDKLN